MRAEGRTRFPDSGAGKSSEGVVTPSESAMGGTNANFGTNADSSCAGSFDSSLGRVYGN